MTQGCMRPGNESRRYNVTTSLIGWAHTYTDPDMTGIKCVTEYPNLFYIWKYEISTPSEIQNKHSLTVTS